MRVGLFTDPHVNKKIQMIQADWKQSVVESFKSMTAQFELAKVDAIICGGDFFDKALIEAWSLRMVMECLTSLDRLNVPVYFLLGNHEIESETENIIEFLDIYPNLKPITHTYDDGTFVLIPYSDDPIQVSMKDRIVVTHHDIYGSSLAAGRSKAKFGIDPREFKDARIVLNGHIHSRSSFVNVRNIGSFLCGAQGELRPGEHPNAYILETDDLSLTELPNYQAIHFVTLESKNLKKYLDYYQSRGCKLVVRYEYETEAELQLFDDEVKNYDNVLRHNLRRLMNIANVGTGVTPQVTSLIDVPSILQRHVIEDPKVEQSMKQEITDIGKVLLDKGRR